jgi:thioredoxin reductase (NADPH)
VIVALIHVAYSENNSIRFVRRTIITLSIKPHTDWLSGTIQVDAKGFILTGSDLLQNGLSPQGQSADRQPSLLETNIPGISAAGDVRHGSIKRIAAEVDEGSATIQLIHQYLSRV